ncbi:porin [Massilia sp. CCM 8734]|uniref:porin n=1 Tax=Massilia sp. CCM 8734 TaxID=2609283 RepID=UPI00141F570C|nr:porin [Massilia sp. CCM 8734]NHZ98685.1 porin [Massilia sp. CCM 8734]
MNKPLRLAMVSVILAAFSMSSQAADGPTVTISGFGTAALTATDTDDIEFARPNQQAGVGKNPRPGVDSNLGIQGMVKMNDWLSFTVQGLARKNARDAWGAELAWAFAKFKINDELSVRVGRMGMPVYMISDFRQVGYANTMIRPPTEVYRQVNGDSFDGVDLVYQHSFGDTTVTAQAGIGNVSAKITDDNRVTYKPATMIHIVAENGPFTFRVGRADAKVTIQDSEQLDGLLATLRRVGLVQVANDLSITDVDGSFTSAGFTMDYKNFLVQTEYAIRRTDSRIVPDTNSYYAMFGYRFGKITPYYYYGDTKQDTARTYAGLPTAGPLAPLTAGVNGVVKAAQQSTNAIGVRWDFAKSAALKVQVDRIKPRDGAGTFLRAKPGFHDTVNVYAAGIDFVF